MRRAPPNAAGSQPDSPSSDGSMATIEDYSAAHEELITATPSRVLAAFFEPTALAAWWLTSRSVTVPQPLGVYAVEWNRRGSATTFSVRSAARFTAPSWNIARTGNSSWPMPIGYPPKGRRWARWRWR